MTVVPWTDCRYIQCYGIAVGLSLSHFRDLDLVIAY